MHPKTRILKITAIIILCLFGLTIPAWAININTNADTFVLSNEAPGYLITQLVNNGYGEYNLYEILVAIQGDTDPSTDGILTPEFLAALAAEPVSAAIFTTKLKDVNTPGTSVAVSTNGTVQVVSIFGRTYYDAGYPTLSAEISGVGRGLFTHSASDDTPLTSWAQTTGLITTTYKVFAIGWSSSVQTFVLSNEAPGYLITKLVNAGYGDYSLYAISVAIQQETDPSVAGIITDNFLTTLRDLPVSSAIFTTKLKNVNTPGTALAISTDGTAQVVSIFGSTYYGQSGTATLASNISGVGTGSFTHSTSDGTPLTSFVADGNTYGVFAIGFSSVSAGEYCGGAGTAGNPYQICSAEALLALAAETNDYDANFVLTADIDLSDYTFTKAVIAPDINILNGIFDGVAFTGDFNGNSHTISNLTIATADGLYYFGLFGHSDGQIKNLRLKKVNITGGHSCASFGGLAGYNGGGINNCSVTGTITGGNYSMYIGGLVGTNSGTIHDCLSTAAVRGETYPGGLGGLVGINSMSTGVISECYARGAVTGGDGPSCLGGLVGYNYHTVSNSYATGDVTGGDNSSDIGGLAGYNYLDISNSYATGVVAGGNTSSHLGGFIGYNVSSSDFNDNYFLVTSGLDNGVGEPLKDKQMRQRANFVGWDFVNIWKIDEGIEYPVLIWEPNQIWVKKNAVTAGVKVSTDKISFAGQMGATLDDFNAATVVTVTIDSEDMDSPYVKTFDVNSTTFKKGKFKGTIINKPSKTVLTFDTKKKAFSFSASNVSLTGLSCPMTIGIKVGGYNGEAWLNEKIVNGPKKPIPIKLLMDVKNSLRVDKSKFTKKSGVITQVAVSGGFSVEDINDANLTTNPLDVTVGSKTFTIPAGNFKYAKGKYSCAKVILSGGEIAAATFDFTKCTFTLTIKGTTIGDAAGTADFSMAFGGFSDTVSVTLP